MGSGIWSRASVRRISQAPSANCRRRARPGRSLLAACGGGGSDDKPRHQQQRRDISQVAKYTDTTAQAKRGGVLKDYAQAEPRTLDPVQPLADLNRIATFVYNTLLTASPASYRRPRARPRAPWPSRGRSPRTA